jgi:hypothetical protein
VRKVWAPPAKRLAKQCRGRFPNFGLNSWFV